MSESRHWVPGYRGVTQLGFKYRTVSLQDVPGSYWARYPSAYQVGCRDRGPGGPWVEFASIEALMEVPRTGGASRSVLNLVPRTGGASRSVLNLDSLGDCYSCIIPEEFFPPEENEFGLISP